MLKKFFALFYLTGTFGISYKAATAIFGALSAAFSEGSITFGRLAFLIGVSGIGAAVIAAIVGFGGAYIAQKLKLGKGAVVAW